MDKKPTLPYDLEGIKQKLKEQFRTGKSLFSKGGAFAPLLEEVLNSMLEGELDAHLDQQERINGNRKNGKGSKTLKSSFGNIEINTPRDRLGNFEPAIIKKRETIMADQLEDRIICLYGSGMSYRDISKYIEQTYDTQISAGTLTNITDRVIPLVREWQQRPLESLYCIVWLDAMYYKVKEDGFTQTRCIYNILGVNKDGKKEVLGMYISQSEGAHFWLGVINDLKQRGVDDILIACIDNLKGFDEAIRTIFPLTEVQCCIIHQIRNSIKYVGSKHHKEFIKDLRPVYKANNEKDGLEQLDILKLKWNSRYPMVIRSWETNWTKLSTYFKYPDQIRRIIYTNNTIEAYHRQIRKVTKTKGAFTSDMALMKLVYLATQEIQKKWERSLPNWSVTVAQLKIIFQQRMKTYLL